MNECPRHNLTQEQAEDVLRERGDTLEMNPLAPDGRRPDFHVPHRDTIPVPKQMLGRPLDDHGFRVPFFVAWFNGKPDHRVIDTPKIAICVNEKRCWLCGGRLGTNLAFTIGPMCAITRTASEPPSHRDCAEYAVRVCPFLTRPHAKRRETDLPADYQEAAGVGLKRNPGVTMLWVSNTFRHFKDRDGKPLFEVGNPRSIKVYCEGREATLEELQTSIATGFPALVEAAELQGVKALQALADTVKKASAILPAGAFGPALDTFVAR